MNTKDIADASLKMFRELRHENDRLQTVITNLRRELAKANKDQEAKASAATGEGAAKG